MTIWTAEIKELEKLYESLKGKFPDLEKELEQLIKTEDANVVMLYSRRCLEVIVTDLCEYELKRPRKTEPLKGIIDKLHHEEKVPEHIITSMHGLNDLSTFGAHPKEFDPEQVRPVLINLTTIIKWYLKYKIRRIEVAGKEKEEIHKTERADELKEIITVRKSKTKSAIIASGILIIGIVLIFAFDVFHIFNKDKFEDLRDPNGRISIAVMPFQNMTNDSLWDVWQGGIQNELITNLSNSEELAVRQYQTMLSILQSTGHTNYASITPSIASDISQKLQANTFIQGSIKSAGGKIRINALLVDAGTEEIYKTFQIDGKTEDDIFIMTDSLSRLLRNYLEIKVLEEDVHYSFKAITTNSAEAYRYAIQGFDFFMETNYPSAIDFFSKALEIDSNFFAARMDLTWAYNNMGMYKEAKSHLLELYNHIENLTYTQQLIVRILKSEYDKDPYAGIKYTGLVNENDPQSGYWWQQGLYYFWTHQVERAIQCLEKALDMDKQWGAISKWPYLYTLPGIIYHELGNHKREKEIYELGLTVQPDCPDIIYCQTVCALSQGDKTESDRLITKYKSILKEKESSEMKLLSYINWIYKGASEVNKLSYLGWIYQDAGIPDEAEKFFRSAYDSEPDNPWSIYQLAYNLINNDKNVDEAMQLIQKGLEKLPDNSLLIQVKGWGLYKQGRLEESLQLLKKAEEKNYVFDLTLYNQIQEVEQALANKNK